MGKCIYWTIQGQRDQTEEVNSAISELIPTLTRALQKYDFICAPDGAGASFYSDNELAIIGFNNRFQREGDGEPFFFGKNVRRSSSISAENELLSHKTKSENRAYNLPIFEMLFRIGEFMKTRGIDFQIDADQFSEPVSIKKSQIKTDYTIGQIALGCSLSGANVVPRLAPVKITPFDMPFWESLSYKTDKFRENLDTPIFDIMNAGQWSTLLSNYLVGTKNGLYLIQGGKPRRITDMSEVVSKIGNAMVDMEQTNPGITIKNAISAFPSLVFKGAKLDVAHVEADGTLSSFCKQSWLTPLDFNLAISIPIPTAKEAVNEAREFEFDNLASLLQSDYERTLLMNKHRQSTQAKKPSSRGTI